MDKRAERVWVRLVQSYGSRVAESYGREMPKPWFEAIADLTDDQVAYGLRKVIRDTPIHPPTVGQFVAACVDMPQPVSDSGPSLQAVLSAYVMLTRYPISRDSKFTADQMRQSSAPWTFLYREWSDQERPKHLQRCAECTGVLVPAAGALPGFRVQVVDMLADQSGHRRALESFKPAGRKADWLTLQAQLS